MKPMPRCSYRLQLHRGFGFSDVAALAPYLAELGVSHVYLSPIFAAVAGSQHGYDVVDHDRVNPELGGEAAHATMCAELTKHGLEQILDIVPNHMAIGTADNRLWWDVLENGPASQYASFFDVDWHGGNDTRVLLPILGEPYGDALAHGLVQLTRQGALFVVAYHEHRYPAAPRSLGPILRAAARDHEELGFLASAYAELPAPTATDRENVQRRQRDKQVLHGYLERLLAGDPALCRRIDDQLAAINGNLTELDAWLESQNWRLAHWRTAATELDYRRFFDVQSLAGLRVEEERVFERVHDLVLRWLRAGTISGLRIDHIDGLLDPEQYLRRLRDRAPDAWIVVEKVAQPDEALRAEWPVDGTTGYELMRLIDQVFVDPSAERVLGPLDEAARGDARPWHELVSDAKRQILDEVLGSERERLIEVAHRALKNRIELRDCTRHSVALAVSALLTSYPVYRTYVREGVEPSALDRALITAVVNHARHKTPEVDARVFSGLEHMLLLEWRGDDERELALRIQQSTGAVCAKAVEDTLFYRMTRLIALNEVGGTPEQLGISPDAFHTALERWPYRCSMLASATHDTKRGEDTRARLFSLSEVAEDFAACMERWSHSARGYRSALVDRATESFFFQTVVGAYPVSLERAQRYMKKAMREAKLQTHWLRPNAAYEAAVQAFVQGVLHDAELMADVGRFVARIAPGGYVTSLSRTLIKLTAPGAPDIYQGCELWDFTLCDPDNRSPVDYAARATSLERVSAMSAREVLSELESGAAKQWLIWKTLSLRKQRPELFAGAYRRVQVGGADAARVIAFARGEALVIVVPRLNQRPAIACDAQVHLPGGEFRNVLTDAVVSGSAPVPARDLLAEFPVALLTRHES